MPSEHFVLRLIVVGARTVQYLVHIICSVSYQSIEKTFFFCPSCSRVELHNFLHLSVNPVLVNSCVLEWLGNIILTVNYSTTSHVCWCTKNIIEISKLYWYSLFPLKDVPFVHNKHICLICGACIMFGNSWFKLAFPPLSAYSTSTSKVCLTMLSMIIYVSNQIAPIINMCTTLS